MLRKVFFWLHLSVGVAAGLFIFVMAATGVMLSFERQIVELVDRNVRLVSVPSEGKAMALNQQLDLIRRAGMGDPTAFVLSNRAQAATQFAIGRGKIAYVDPYSGALLGGSSARAHDFFSTIERLHRTLGAQLGNKNMGRWLTGISNLLFAVLIPLGLLLWLPRKWNWKSVRASLLFRTGLGGKAREWNWHNVLGIWCALPLLVIALTGTVMSFDWANALLFRLSGSAPPAGGRTPDGTRPHGHESRTGLEPDYDRLFTAAKTLNPDWRTITLNITRDANAPVTAVVDNGTGGQPQKRAQYLLKRDSGAVMKTTTFADGSLGQRLRSFVRFGHTGEYGGLPGQAIAAIASFGACVLVYTGLSLSIRRLTAKIASKRRNSNSARDTYGKDLSLDGTKLVKRVHS